MWFLVRALSDLLMVTFSVSSHGRKRKNERALVSLLEGTLIPLDQGLTLMTPFNLKDLENSHPVHMACSEENSECD